MLLKAKGAKAEKKCKFIYYAKNNNYKHECKYMNKEIENNNYVKLKYQLFNVASSEEAPWQRKYMP